MKEKTEIEKIKDIMSKGDPHLSNKIELPYGDINTIQAIQNWANNGGVYYDLTVINALENVCMRGGVLNKKQIIVIERIIDGYGIDLERWLL